MSMEAISSMATTDFLADGGELGALMRDYDWSTSPLGPPAHWPQSLKIAVRIMLSSRYPMCVWWGEERITLKNDAYVSVIGQRHPWALGRPAREVRYEIWDLVGAQSDLILKEGKASWHDKVLLIMERNGYPEETYFPFSHSPIPDDDGGIGGVFCACTEDTAQIVSQRRLKMLRQLAERTAEEAKAAEDVFNTAATILADYPNDKPCALLYLLDEDERQAQLAAATRLAASGPASPAVIALDDGDAPWPLRTVLDTRKPQPVDRLFEQCKPRVPHTADAHSGPRGRDARRPRRHTHRDTARIHTDATPQRPALAKTRQCAARLRARRGRTHRGLLRACGSRDFHPRTRERLRLRHRACGAAPHDRLPAPRSTDLCRSRHVGKDRPQPRLQCLQVHLRGRHHRIAAPRGRMRGAARGGHRLRHRTGRIATRVRAVPSRAGRSGAHARGLGHRTCAGAGTGAPARRHAAHRQRTRQRQRVHRESPDRSRPPTERTHLCAALAALDRERRGPLCGGGAALVAGFPGHSRNAHELA